ncbi:MAG: hypothetical protein JXB17_13785 [Bacteroidales bacterium]|nr:hypothetical protein [Bacteroidales bacterium]
MIYGLIFGCPFDVENENCPFKKIRQMPLEERVNLIGEMDQLDICNLIETHSKCLYFRENRKIKIQNQRIAV